MSLVRKYQDPFNESLCCCSSKLCQCVDLANSICPDDRDLMFGRCCVCGRGWYKEKSTGKLFRLESEDD